MKKTLYENTFLEREKNLLNEMANDVIYDESQCGPQEEPFNQEFKISTKKYKKFCKNKIK